MARLTARLGDAGRAAYRLVVAQIKRVLPHTLLGRSLLIIVTPLVLLQLITATIFYERHWRQVTRRLADALAGDIALVVEHMRTYPSPEDETWILETARLRMALRVTYLRGKVLSEIAPPRGSAILDPALTRSLRDALHRPLQIDTGSRARWVEIRIQLADGVLRVLAPRKRLWSSTTYIFILWMVGTSIILFAVATVFMRNQVRPIRRLAAAAEMFGKGRNVPDFKLSGALEVRQAANAFNIMRARIQRQISQRTDMLAGVSHDLRTPLTRMKLQLAMLGDGADVQALATDVADMEKMVEGYLAFARGEAAEEPVKTDLGKLIEDVAEKARGHGAKVDMRRTGNITVTVRPNAFKRCLTNLIDNAATHGNAIAIQARRRGRAVEIVIDDNGPGIPRNRRAEVFKPFFRLDPARNPETGGIGLGLTIARDVIRGHGGDITLGDSPEGGLRASLRLPV